MGVEYAIMLVAKRFFEKVDYSLEKPGSGMFGTGYSNGNKQSTMEKL